MVSALQLVLILIAITIVSYDVLMTQVCVKCAGESVILGLLVGAIMGDVTTGLLVGGTMQLMSLGLAGYGGASVPNYRVGTTVGATFAIATGGGLEVALVVGIPAATLGMDANCHRLTEPLYKSITAVDKNMFRATLIDHYSEVILNAKGVVMK